MNTELFEIIKQLNGSLNKWIGIKEVSNYASISQSTIRRAIQTGHLKANKVGGKWLIKSEWIEAYLNKEYTND